MIIARKIEKRNCGCDTFLSGKQAVQRAWALALATSLLISFTCAALAAAGNLERKERP
jgi:hypothetical protein